ncbi:electron transfer flavoprotein subunit beta [Halomonas halocynthiae]|uniref:electron transfer flavoprotein subunit beta n=1 Tax=Halomonas halocynthiae TaxID=176290 RepID=UPI001F0A3D20|nr:electron transfer flavoprotein subunit beta [Halomonas halocynthiae]
MMPHELLKVVALVSVGAHPVTGRPRRAEQDARAVELGLCLAGKHLHLLHAGDAESEALRGYLGMGLAEMTVLQQPLHADILPALGSYLGATDAQLVLTGSQAEIGEGSGMLPYLLAEQLDWPLVVGLAEVESVKGGVAQVLQALPRGQRRRLQVRLPFVASVDSAAPKARQSAFGPAQRGQLQSQKVAVVEDMLLSEASMQTARPRPKRLKVIKAKTGAERMRAATAKASAGGKVLTDITPEQGAEAIFALLKEEKVLR